MQPSFCATVPNRLLQLLLLWHMRCTPSCLAGCHWCGCSGRHRCSCCLTRGTAPALVVPDAAAASAPVSPDLLLQWASLWDAPVPLVTRLQLPAHLLLLLALQSLVGASGRPCCCTVLVHLAIHGHVHSNGHSLYQQGHSLCWYGCVAQAGTETANPITSTVLPGTDDTLLQDCHRDSAVITYTT